MRNLETPGAMKALTFLLFRGLAYFGLISASSSAMAQNLSDLPTPEQTEIEMICLPVQYSTGAAAYRECVNEQVVIHLTLSATPASKLSFDERYAIQQTCQQSGSPGTDVYIQCSSEQVDSLADVPAPRLALLSDDENYALQQTCFDAQLSLGVKAYRQCLNEALRKLRALPEPDLSSLAILEKNALQMRCSSLHTDAADYRTCLLDAVGGSGSVELPVTAAQLSNNPENDLNTELAPASQAAETVLEIDSGAQAISNAAENTNTSPVANEVQATVSVETQTEAFVQTASESADQLAAPVENVAATATASVADNLESASESPEPSELPADNNTPAAFTSEPTVSENTGSAAQSAQSQSADGNNGSISEDAAVIAANTATLTNASNSIEPVKVANSSTPTAVIAAENTTQNIIPVAADSGPNSTFAETAESETAEKLNDAKAPLLSQIQSTLGSLTLANRLFVFAAMALSILLAGIWLMMRRHDSKPAYVPPAHPEPLTERVNTSSQRRTRATTETEQETMTEPVNFKEQADELFGAQPDVRPETRPEPHADSQTTIDARGAVTREVSSRERSVLAAAANSRQALQSEPATAPQSVAPQQPQQAEGFDSGATTHEAPIPSANTTRERAGFLNWLSSHAEHDQLGLVIEFLIYWTAYADERYEPDLKARIFSLKEPDDHDLIKRWVLKQDVSVFADSVRWLQSNASEQQHMQLLNLLMTLLVNENALTPVQNTLLRFLSDVFGIGSEKLEENFTESYGHKMPSLPRVDKPNWWNRQTRENLTRWDARWVSAQETELQHRVKLGLPLKGSITEEIVHTHFRRAISRCQPERFNALGEREQMLAQNQIAKFESARDELLGVSA